MSFRELVEADLASIVGDVAKKLGKKIQTGVATSNIKPENRLGDKKTVTAPESDDSKGYGKRSYMGDDVEDSGVSISEATIWHSTYSDSTGKKYKGSVTARTPEQAQMHLEFEHKNKHGSSDGLAFGKFRHTSGNLAGPRIISLSEGDVHYGKATMPYSPKFGTGKAKWRQTTAAVRTPTNNVGAGELGAHNGGSGHIKPIGSEKVDRLAIRQTIHDTNKNATDQSAIKKFALKQTRAKTVKESDEMQSFKELIEGQLDEASRDKLTSYIQRAKVDTSKDRSEGIKLAQKKKWGDAKFGFEEPKVKATNESAGEREYHVHGYFVDKETRSEKDRPNVKVHAIDEIDARAKAFRHFNSKGIKPGEHYNLLHAQLNESITEGFVVKNGAGKVVSVHGADSMANAKAAELSKSTGQQHTVHFDREAHSNTKLEESTQDRAVDAARYMNTANHALDQALKHNSSSDEHHRWMTVHHKAMSVHHHLSNNPDASSSHDAMGERHGTHISGEDDSFHNGESHHWDRM